MGENEEGGLGDLEVLYVGIDCFWRKRRVGF